MKTVTRLVAALGLAITTVPALAATGQIDSFGASASTVVEGTTVDFSVSFGVSTSAWMNGGSNPIEPEPQEGFQTWDINWYQYQNETLTQVMLDAAGQSFMESVSASPGSGYSSGWSFSLFFPTAGHFEITVGGGWASQMDSYISNESATRDCYNSDPGGSNQLVCTSWEYHYYDYSDLYSTDGSFSSLSLSIDVVAAAVPEPSTWLLWLAGMAALLALSSRSIRSQDAA